MEVCGHVQAPMFAACERCVASGQWFKSLSWPTPVVCIVKGRALARARVCVRVCARVCVCVCVLQVSPEQCLAWLKDLAQQPTAFDTSNETDMRELLTSPEALAVLRCKEAFQARSNLHR